MTKKYINIYIHTFKEFGFFIVLLLFFLSNIIKLEIYEKIDLDRFLNRFIYSDIDSYRQINLPMEIGVD